MEKPLTIAFCLPGSSFSGKFLECWTNLLAWCLTNNIRPVLSRRQSCNIYYVRNMCLGGDVSRGESQKPFNGQLDYDYIMWIDSDILFAPEHFQMLLRHQADVISGIYKMDGGQAFATMKNWDEEYFKQNGCFEFLTEKDNEQEKGLFAVAYNGMGFFLTKRGVFESLEYPWFRPLEKRIGEMSDFTMEDVSLCLRVQEKGFKVQVDPLVRVGHEKNVIL